MFPQRGNGSCIFNSTGALYHPRCLLALLSSSPLLQTASLTAFKCINDRHAAQWWWATNPHQQPFWHLASKGSNCAGLNCPESNGFRSISYWVENKSEPFPQANSYSIILYLMTLHPPQARRTIGSIPPTQMLPPPLPCLCSPCLQALQAPQSTPPNKGHQYVPAGHMVAHQSWLLWVKGPGRIPLKRQTCGYLDHWLVCQRSRGKNVLLGQTLPAIFAENCLASPPNHVLCLETHGEC